MVSDQNVLNRSGCYGILWRDARHGSFHFPQKSVLMDFLEEKGCFIPPVERATEDLEVLYTDCTGVVHSQERHYISVRPSFLTHHSMHVCWYL